MADNRASRRRTKGKTGKSAKGGNGVIAGLKGRWHNFQQGKSPILIFLLKFLAVLIPFYAFWFTSFFKDTILAGWNSFNAAVSSVFLNIFGAGTTASGDMLSGADDSIRIFEGCDGIEPTMLLVAGIVAFPAPMRHKLRGIVFGGLFLLGMNLVRIISLYVVRVNWEDGFEFMHREFWQVAFILLAIVVWVYWMRKAPLEKEDNNGNDGEVVSEPA